MTWKLEKSTITNQLHSRAATSYIVVIPGRCDKMVFLHFFGAPSQRKNTIRSIPTDPLTIRVVH